MELGSKGSEGIESGAAFDEGERCDMRRMICEMRCKLVGISRSYVVCDSQSVQLRSNKTFTRTFCLILDFDNVNHTTNFCSEPSHTIVEVMVE